MSRLPNLDTASTWTTPGGNADTALPTRRELAAIIAAEHAAKGHPITAAKANRLAVRQLAQAPALTAEATAGGNPLTYRDETGDTAVWNILAAGGDAA